MFHSVQFITFLKIFDKFLPFIGLMPIVDFDTMKLINVNVYKFYCAIISSISILFWCNNFLPYYRMYKDLLPPRRTMLIILELLNMLTYNITIWGSAFWNRNCWMEFLKKCDRIETKWYINRNVSWYKNGPFLAFLLGTFVMVLNFALHFPFFEKKVDVFYGYLGFHIFMFYSYYVPFLQNFIVYNVSINIKYKYKNLAKMLTNACCKQIKLNDSNFGETMRNTSKTFHRINTTVDEFNQLFGWQILLSLITAGIISLSTLDAIYNYFSGNLERVEQHLVVLLANIMLQVLFCVSLR